MGCSTPTLMPLQFGVQPARLPCVTCKAAPRSADRLLVRASSCRGLVAAFAGAEGVALSRCAAQVCVCVCVSTSFCVLQLMCVALRIASGQVKPLGRSWTTNWSLPTASPMRHVAAALPTRVRGHAARCAAGRAGQASLGCRPGSLAGWASLAAAHRCCLEQP